MPETMIIPIESDRLILKPMSLPFLHMIIERNFAMAQKICGATIPPHCSMPDGVWLKRRMAMIEQDDEQHKWMYRAVIRKEDNTMIGHISFHHKAPDPDLLDISDLAVELGYTINQDCRRKGFAKESAIAMMEWAHSEAKVRTFILTISPSNTPSLQMARSMNFKKIGERIDEFDGLEYTMRGKIEDILQTKHTYQATTTAQAHR